MGATELAEAPSAVWTRTDVPRLRPIANEDVYLFVKRIDNSSVIRAVDPAAQSARSKSMATGFAAAVLIIAGLVPTAYNVTAGFALQQLRQEQTQLERQRADGRSTLVYEHIPTGEVRLIDDPGLKLGELTTVQDEVARLLSPISEAPAPVLAESPAPPAKS